MHVQRHQTGSSSQLMRPRSTQSRKGAPAQGQTTGKQARQNHSNTRQGNTNSISVTGANFSNTQGRGGLGLNVTGTRAPGAQSGQIQMSVIGTNSSGIGMPPRAGGPGRNNSHVASNENGGLVAQGSGLVVQAQHIGKQRYVSGASSVGSVGPAGPTSAQQQYYQQQVNNAPSQQNIRDLRRRISEVTTANTPTQQQRMQQMSVTSRQQQQQFSSLKQDQFGQVSFGVGLGEGPANQGIVSGSMHGSAQSHTSKMPPQAPISAQRRKILAAQHAAAQQIMQPGATGINPQNAFALQQQQVQLMNSTQSSHASMISPDNIIRPNGSRYSDKGTEQSQISSPPPSYQLMAQSNGSIDGKKPPLAEAIQYNLGAQRLSQDNKMTGSPSQYTPTVMSKLSKYAHGNEAALKQHERLMTAQGELISKEGMKHNPDFNLNLHPQQVAQSTSLSHTNGETGTEGKRTGTDENNTNEVGPFSDDGMSDSSGNVAVEFAEDPIEKTRHNRRNLNSNANRVIPDRVHLEEIREQVLNNFMLSPWGAPQNQEEKKEGGGASPKRPAKASAPPAASKPPVTSTQPTTQHQSNQQQPKSNTGPLIQRRLSPKPVAQAAVSGQVKQAETKGAAGGHSKEQATEYYKQKILEMQFPLWKEESIPDIFNDDDDMDLLANRNYETLLEYDDENAQQSYQQQTRQKEEAEIANYNFESYLLRQQIEEEEEERKTDFEEEKFTRPAHLAQANSDNDDDSDCQASKKQRGLMSGKVKKRREALKNQFAVNVSYCRSELETIQAMIQISGFTEVTAGGKLYWFGLSLMDRDIKTMMKKKVYFNRYPGMEYLCRKKEFCTINNRIRRTFPKLFNFSPISFLIPEEANALELYMEQHPRFFFIAKPSRGRGGDGIILVSRFKDIPKNVFTHEEKDLLVQRYIRTPMLLEDKKFDLRLYVLVKGFDPMEAYLCDEGLARLCTEPYRQPNAGNMKNMFMHLTNFSLNKNSDNYKAPDQNFLASNDTSKRLLTQLYETLEEQGHDVDRIKERIADTVKKAVVAMEPYLMHTYHTRVTQNHSATKAFQILGMDILLDKKMNAWLMEVNANPSLNMFLEKDVDPASGIEPEKMLSELDKFVKTKVVTESVRLVTGEGSTEFEGSFEQLLPSAEEDFDRFYIWNRALQLFELMIKTGKASEAVTLFQFSKLARVPEFSRANQFFKADLDICFKNMQRKHDCVSLNLDGFFDAIEALCKKIYKDEEVFETCLSNFLDAAIPFFEEQQTNTKTQ